MKTGYSWLIQRKPTVQVLILQSQIHDNFADLSEELVEAVLVAVAAELVVQIVSHRVHVLVNEAMKPGNPLLLSSGLLEIGVELNEDGVRLSRAECKADSAELDLEAVGQ